MVFLHIPKTGGSSVAQALKERGAELVEDYYSGDFERFGFPKLGTVYEDRHG